MTLILLIIVLIVYLVLLIERLLLLCHIQQNNVHGIVRIVKSIDVDGC